MDDNSLFTQRLDAGKRTYYFDVKEASNQGRYLKITAITQRGDHEERQHINISERCADEFAVAFSQALAHLIPVK